APGVCCVSPDDCNSIGANETERPCSMGLACIDHQCEVPPPGCHFDSDCSGATPHCASDGTCVGCIDSTQCSADAPTCDATSHLCRACESDDECESSVCDQKAGTCVSEAAVLYASPSGGDTAPCTKTTPCSIAQAFAVADQAHQTIKLMPGS